MLLLTLKNVLKCVVDRGYVRLAVNGCRRGLGTVCSLVWSALVLEKGGQLTTSATFKATITSFIQKRLLATGAHNLCSQSLLECHQHSSTRTTYSTTFDSSLLLQRLVKRFFVLFNGFSNNFVVLFRFFVWQLSVRCIPLNCQAILVC